MQYRTLFSLAIALSVVMASRSHAAARNMRIDDPNHPCGVYLWGTTSADPNALDDGNADSAENPGTFFNPGTVVTAPAIFCTPTQSLSSIWNSTSINAPPALEATQDPPNPASVPDPTTKLPTVAELTATNAVLYEWLNPDMTEVDVPDAEVIIWTLPAGPHLPSGGYEIEFDNWCGTNNYLGSDPGGTSPAPSTAVPSFTWMGFKYVSTDTCATFNSYDLLIDSSGQLAGYVDLSTTTNPVHFTPSVPGWQVTAIPVPTGLTSVSSSGGTVTLSWTPSANATSYNLYQSQTSGGEGVSGPSRTGITTTSVTFNGWTPGATAYFKIAAVYSGAQSGLSTELTATALPVSPGGLSATAGTTSIALQWSAAAGASSYSVSQANSSGGEGATAVASGITGTSYTVSGLSPGQTWFFTVAAVNAGGHSTASNEASTTLVASAPTGVVATSETSAIALSWNPSPGASGYNIYQGTSPGAESNTPAAAAVTGTSATISGLTAGQTYYFKMAAVNAGGTSVMSTEITATVIAAAPTGLVATAQTGAVSLSWSASTGATGYSIYQGTSAGGEATTAVLASVSGTTATITGLTGGQMYYFKVAAVDAGGMSAQSAEASATPAAPAPPPAATTSHGGGGAIHLADILILTALLLATLQRDLHRNQFRARNRLH